MGRQEASQRPTLMARHGCDCGDRSRSVLIEDSDPQKVAAENACSAIGPGNVTGCNWRGNLSRPFKRARHERSGSRRYRGGD
jgi:hypothetical protein